MKISIFIGLLFFSNQLLANENQYPMEDLLTACAPDVHPQTMGAIVSHESRGNYLIIGDNGDWDIPKKDRVHKTYYPSSIDEAVQISNTLIADGHVIDIGLGQLNNRNLARLNMSLYDAFEPCKNLSGASKVLVDFYQSAQRKYGPGREALYAAISAYNTGNFTNGLKNGYVSKVVTAGSYVVPKLNVGTEKQRNRSVQVSRAVYKTAKNPKNKFNLNDVKNAPSSVIGWEN